MAQLVLEGEGSIYGLKVQISYIKKMFHEWNLFKRINAFSNCSDEKKIDGAILYGKLYLGFNQKVFCRVTSELRSNILIRWRQIKNLVFQLKPKQTRSSRNGSR